jgi:uncharacterized OB-fold protein
MRHAPVPQNGYLRQSRLRRASQPGGYEFADQPAKIKTFTGDLLAVSVDPPHKYGMVQFDNGGRMMADFTDCDFEELQVGLPMQMVFRKRTEDKQRGFVNYFWKATPAPARPSR